MKKIFFLIGMSLFALNPIFAQSKSVMEHHPQAGELLRINSPQPKAYTGNHSTISTETTRGVVNSAIQPDQITGSSFITYHTWPNIPEGFEENLVFVNGPHLNEDNLSIMETDLGMDSYGFNAGNSLGYHLAEDFRLLLETEISSITLYSYQTGENSATITAAYVQIWDGEPGNGGSVVWGDTSTNILTDAVTEGEYRVLDTDQNNTDRLLQRLTVNTNGLTLDSGTYWISYTLEGSGSSGPWSPPIVVWHKTTTGNALQSSDSGSTWTPLLDGGTGEPAGIPFEIHGTVIDGCAEVNPPNDWYFEDAYRINDGYATANDLTVDPGKKFTLENITFFLATDEPPATVNLEYYEDDAGLPGTLIGSENNATIKNYEVIGSTEGQVTGIYQVDVETDPFVFEGQESSSTTYWISAKIENTQGTSVFWVGIADQSVGHPLALNDGTSDWYHPRSDFDGTYVFNGTCDDLLGVNDHEVTLVTVYPNPTTGILNIESKEEIDRIQVYNLLGQQVMNRQMDTANGTIDLSHLQKGVYILKTEIDNKTETFKVIKD